jgi:hypothetical protein
MKHVSRIGSASFFRKSVAIILADILCLWARDRTRVVTTQTCLPIFSPGDGNESSFYNAAFNSEYKAMNESRKVVILFITRL